MGECPMIRLSSVIEQFEGDFLQQYADRLLPSQGKALAAMKTCKNRYSPLMQAHCEPCDNDQYFPHSCGNRHCPHCQHHESQQWLENQCRSRCRLAISWSPSRCLHSYDPCSSATNDHVTACCLAVLGIHCKPSVKTIKN